MSSSQTLLGRGIYDSGEVARLAKVAPRDVSRWAGDVARGGGLLFPVDRRLFNFWDLLTAHVTADLLARAVPLHSIRDARDYLQQFADGPWPLAHLAGLSRLAHVGEHVYVDANGEGDWIDATLSGQAPLRTVIQPYLKLLAVSFDPEGLASSWQPCEGIILQPRVQAGSPCVQGTRVPTQLLADMNRQNESVEDLASAYGLDRDLVQRAVDYEAGLEKLARRACRN